MNLLQIAKGEFTPEVLFDPENHTFKMEGVSRPENVSAFYTEVIEWITTYESELYKNHVLGGKKFGLTFSFQFSYFNSASSKLIFQLLECLVRIKSMGYGTDIFWYYEEGDDQMREDGEELSEAIEIPFTINEIPS
jgi:hypothetical protein